MQFLNQENPLLDQHLYINSMGGSLLSGLAVYDTMRSIAPRMFTTCIGHASSMASFLLCSADYRFALKNSQMMIHQPATGLEGQALDIGLESGQVTILRTKVCGIYSKVTGQSKFLINDDMDRDAFMSAPESVKYGLIDSVIDNTIDLTFPSYMPTVLREIEESARYDNTRSENAFTKYEKKQIKEYQYEKE